MIVLEGFAFGLLWQVLLYAILIITGLYITYKTILRILTGYKPVKHYAVLHPFGEPFVSATTEVTYSLNAKEKVKLEVLNLRNEHLLTLVNESKEEGNHSIVLKTDDFPNGEYKLKFTTPDRTSVKRMLIYNKGSV